MASGESLVSECSNAGHNEYAMGQPLSGEERSRILERMGLRVSLKQKREPSEWLSAAKERRSECGPLLF